MNWLWLLAGPLCGPECRRMLSRDSMWWLRALCALPAVGLLAIAVWWWWLRAGLIPNWLPSDTLHAGLAILEGLLVTGALLLAPAMLAGTLAGDKDRGTLLMLLTSRVSAWEIVAGRLVSRICLIAVLLSPSLPVLVLLAALLARPVTHLAALLALPAAVAIGGGGLALAASALARRGRDALLAVYLLDLLFLAVPASVRGLTGGTTAIWSALNPFACLPALIDRPPSIAPAATTIAVWATMGLAAAVFAAWRLTPVYLKQLDGSRHLPGRQRSFLVPQASRSVLWKEMLAERTVRMSGVVRGIGWLVAALVLTASAGLAGVTAWIAWRGEDAAGAAALGAAEWLREMVGFAAMPLSWLLQWAVGLRSAVAIASERERDTWDVLLSTPLEGRDIVWAKLAGSLYALRGMFAVAAICWSVALLCEAIDPRDFWRLLAATAVVGTFMAAVGVLCSVSLATATRAMTVTLAVWLAAAVAIGATAGFIYVVVILVVFLAWFMATGMGWVFAGPPPGLGLPGFWEVTRLALYALAAVLIGWHCRRRFDSLAGRAYARRPPRWELEPDYWDVLAEGNGVERVVSETPASPAVAAPPPQPAATASSAGPAANGRSGNG